MTTGQTIEDRETGHQIASVVLRQIADDNSLLEVGRKAIEDALIDWRNRRLSCLQRNNGLVIREADGGESSMIRHGPEYAMRIGIRAIADHLARTPVKES